MKNLTMISRLCCLCLALGFLGCSKQAPQKPVSPKASVPEVNGKLDKLNAAVKNLGGSVNLKGDAKLGRGPNIGFGFSDLSDSDVESLLPLIVEYEKPLELYFSSCDKVTPAIFSKLATVKNLVGISYESDEMTDDQVLQFKEMTQLRVLELTGEKLTDKTYEVLDKLANLERFELVNSSDGLGDSKLPHVKNLAKLKEIRLGADDLTDAGLVNVRDLKELRKLYIGHGKITHEGMKHFENMTKLEEVTINTYPFSGKDRLKFLANNPNMVELALNCHVNADDAPYLKNFPKLKTMISSGIADEALTGIGQSPQLEEIVMQDAEVGDAGLKNLADLKNLKRLYLASNQITDEGMKGLAGMTSLVFLDLSDNKNITDKGLIHLAKLPNLEVLSLSNNKIVGPGLENLKELKKLRSLWLNGNPISDPGLEYLKTYPKLELVELAGTKVSDEALLALKKATPKVEITDYAGDKVSLTPPVAPKPKVVNPAFYQRKPDFRLSATDFYDEKEKNKEEAEKKYSDKILEITGIVREIREGPLDAVTVKLCKPDNNFHYIDCSMANLQVWFKISKGQTVTINGKCNGYLSLDDAVVVKAEADPNIKIAIDDFANEFAKDEEKATDKYREKSIQLSAEIIDREFSKRGNVSIFLKSKSNAKIKCSLSGLSKYDAKRRTRPGMTVTIKGVIEPVYTKEGMIYFDPCFLMN